MVLLIYLCKDYGGYSRIVVNEVSCSDIRIVELKTIVKCNCNQNE